MAFTQIPNEALDRMAEISAGALRLYLFLCRCRNQTSGKCNPSVQTTAEAIDVHPKNVFKLRKELVDAKWAKFDGDYATDLLGIGGSKNATNDIADIELKPESSKNTTLRVVGSKNATISAPVVAKTLPMVAKTLPKGSKNATAIYEEQYEGTILIEQDMSGAVAPAVSSDVQQIFAYWQNRMNHPTAHLTDKRKKLIQARLKEKYTVEDIKRAIDGCASSPFHMGQNDRATVYDDIELICRDGGKLESFISKVNGSNGNGRHQVPHKETPNERNAREYEELVRRSLAASDSGVGPDTADTDAPGITVDFRRL